MATSPRERILEATLACVARYGMAKTTVEDVARSARLSRATVYRHFPGGRDQLVRETITWEAARFFTDLAAAVADAPDLASLLEEALLFARAALVQHEVLQKVLETEPDVLLPQLTLESHRIRRLAAGFLVPHVERSTLRPGVEPAAAADHLARMLLSLVASPAGRDLTDRATVRATAATLLAGVTGDT